MHENTNYWRRAALPDNVWSGHKMSGLSGESFFQQNNKNGWPQLLLHRRIDSFALLLEILLAALNRVVKLQHTYLTSLYSYANSTNPGLSDSKPPLIT